MGRYGGGRGQKWPKIGDVFYGWPLEQSDFQVSNKLEGTELDLGINSSESLANGTMRALFPFPGPLRLSARPGS